MLGLEYTAGDLVSNLKTQYPAGLVDFTLNAVPGAVAALLMGWGPVAAVVLAGVTWISSSGVIAKVMGDLGRVGNRETPVILSILVLEDLAMAVYLPIITALLAGLAVTAGIEPAMGPLAIAYVLILVVIGPLTARYTEPVAARAGRRRTPSPPVLTVVPSQHGSPEDLKEQAQDPAGRA